MGFSTSVRRRPGRPLARLAAHVAEELLTSGLQARAELGLRAERTRSTGRGRARLGAAVEAEDQRDDEGGASLMQSSRREGRRQLGAGLERGWSAMRTTPASSTTTADGGTGWARGQGGGLATRDLRRRARRARADPAGGAARGSPDEAGRWRRWHGAWASSCSFLGRRERVATVRERGKTGGREERDGAGPGRGGRRRGRRRARPAGSARLGREGSCSVAAGTGTRR